MNKVIKAIEQKQLKDKVTDFKIGDTVKVYTKIVEGSNERIQMFSGVVIARNGADIRETFTVRRVSFGYGVERVFPLHSPRVDRIEVERKGRVRRAKLYYLRDKVGKGAKIKEQLRFAANAAAPAVQAPAAEAAPAPEAAPAAEASPVQEESSETKEE